jgi:hypothetical protein
MSFSNSVGAFSLDNVIVRRPIMFPDGTVQSTAFGGVRVADIEDTDTTPIVKGALTPFLTISSLVVGKTYTYSGYIQINNNVDVKDQLEVVIQSDADTIIDFRSSQNIYLWKSNNTIYIPICFTTRNDSNTSTVFSYLIDWDAPGAGIPDIQAIKMEVFETSYSTI